MLTPITKCTYDFPDNYGRFYFGQASVPLEVSDGIYQIKCLYRRQETSKYFDIVYLQFEKNSYSLDFLKTFANGYIFTSHGHFYLTDNPQVFSIIDIDKAKIVRQSKYDASKMNCVYRRLQKISLQKKPILK